MVRNVPETTALLDREALDQLLLEWAVQSGERMRKRRGELKLTQLQVGRLADTTPETVCRVELGQLTPRENLKLSLAFALLTEVAAIWPPLDRKVVNDRAGEPAEIMEATA